MERNFIYEADIAIIGGGIAGCTLAMALASSYKVILVDKLETPVERVGECLAPASRRILRKLDLLNNIVLHNSDNKLYLPSLGTRSYWGSETLHVADHLKNPDGAGWHLNRRDFETHLRKETSERNVHCLWGFKLFKSHYEAYCWNLVVRSVTGDETARIKAKFVVDASGRLSVFAKQIGVNRTHFDKLVAYWAILPNHNEAKMGTISSAAIGWWYTSPLPNNKRVIALQTDPDLVDKQIVKDASWFIDAAKANKDMKGFVTAAEDQIEYRGVVAANSTRLEQVSGKQWVAIGDAAMSFDPLSSQGMFNAMAGAMQLAELLLSVNACSLGQDEKLKQVQAAYDLQMDNIWNRYVQHKDLFYTQETRWKDALFWQRRNAGILSGIDQ